MLSYLINGRVPLRLGLVVVLKSPWADAATPRMVGLDEVSSSIQTTIASQSWRWPIPVDGSS